MIASILFATSLGAPPPQCYRAKVESFDPNPVLSSVGGSSDYTFVFNPSWVEATKGTSGKEGLLLRTQNCSKTTGTGGKCSRCSGTGPNASVLTFSRLMSETDNHTATPTFERVTSASFVFGPHDDTDIRGTEDPRIAWDEESQLYYMFYTCWAKNKLGTLCLATTADPTSSGGWTRHGAPFGGNHKSGALLIRDEQSKPSTPHYLISGAGEIHISHSKNLLNWTLGPLFINETLWGNPHVEAGPPPMRLADGNFVFFLNSWGGKDVPQPGYQPAWVILDKDDPSHILARAPKPLWSPTDQLWMEGKPPSLCNVPQVAFLEAAHPAGKDNFRVYFGGADAVVGTALVGVERVPGVSCS
tara:strand:+ start:104 stop:1177 length:1074 start_codon:yes stop_codon:yes gene_type:complete